MDDQTLETILRSGDETAPAALRERIRALVHDEPVLHEVDAPRRRSRRTAPALVAAVTVVLLIGGIIGVVRLRSTSTPADPTVSTSLDNAATTTAPPATTIPSTTVLDVEATRLDGLPASDPVTLTRRPGELWPMSDLLTGGANGFRGFWAGEERNGNETIRTVSYVNYGTRCSLDLHPPASDVAETAVPPDCIGAIVVQARFGAPQPSATTTPTIPLTGGGEIWAHQTNDPGGIPLCLENRACTSPITLERRVDDVPITITFTDGIPERLLDETPEAFDAASYIQLAQSIYLYDEATGRALPNGSFTPRNIDPTTEFGWFRGTTSGPLVAVTDDGERELRVRNDGNDITFYYNGESFHVFSPYDIYLTDDQADAPGEPLVTLGWDWNSPHGKVPVFGMTDPSVFELEFEATDGEVFVASTGDLSGTFHHQFFILTMPWRTTLRDNRGVLISALDADGNVIERYQAESCCGIWRVDDDGRSVDFID